MTVVHTILVGFAARGPAGVGLLCRRAGATEGVVLTERHQGVLDGAARGALPPRCAEAPLRVRHGAIAQYPPSTSRGQTGVVGGGSSQPKGGGGWPVVVDVIDPPCYGMTLKKKLAKQNYFWAKPDGCQRKLEAKILETEKFWQSGPKWYENLRLTFSLQNGTIYIYR